MPGPATERGKQAERRACAWLTCRGLALVESNYRSPFGEIDLIMRQGATLVFVEVRMRRSGAYGTPAETVDGRKQARLRATAEHYLAARGDSKKTCRFDIVAFTGSDSDHEIEWLQNAF